MKISLSWLQEYVPGKYDVDHLADRLTMVGLEVEAVTNRFDYLETVQVGRIETVMPHPKSDHLKYCRVNTGNGQYSVVCGAPNTTEGILAPLALPGTVFPNGFVLQKTVIRGQVSEGMLCSGAELGLSNDADGLMLLDAGLTLGQPLNHPLKLNDPVLEIDLTPNRADCLGILGIGREIAAIKKTKLRYPDVPPPASGETIHQLTSVAIEAPDLCPRYAACLVTGIAVGPSPFWLQDRLRSVGLRPINNVVDITNFVMMETGQPLHGFDFDRLADNRIVVRTARAGDQFTTLDGQSRNLADDTLMICDGEKPIAVAGVMGGLNSEIEATTTRVLIESACFNPASIRRTAKQFNLSTDASYRFERGVDPQGSARAMMRAAQLMVDICGGTLVDGFIDAHPRPWQPSVIELSVESTNRVLGTHLNGVTIKQLLESIEFTVQPAQKDQVLNVTPPSYRVDISRPEDLMEEVARLHGYNQIPTAFPAITDSQATTSAALSFRQRIKTLVTGFGFVEAIVYSFGDKKTYDHLGINADDPRRRFVTLLNPLTETQAIMRTSLAPGLLDTVRYNISRQNHNLQLFEIGRVFENRSAHGLPNEDEIIAGLWTGRRAPHTWQTPATDCDFYDLKGVVESLLKSLHIEHISFSRLDSQHYPYYQSGTAAEISTGGAAIGVIGSVAMEVLKAFDIAQTVFMFELNIASLKDQSPSTRQARPLPRYPAITRDMTVIVDIGIESAKLAAFLSGLDEPLVESIALVDLFEGPPISEDKKSLSFRVTYRSNSKTLVDDMINDVHRQITHQLVKNFDAGLPT